MPPGAQAVVVNVTAIDHSSGITLVTAYPAGTTRPVASNINLAGNTVESNLVIVQLSQAAAPCRPARSPCTTRWAAPT